MRATRERWSQVGDATAGDGAHFPVTHSNLSPEALVAQIVSRHDVGEIKTCRLHNRGLTDTYILETAGDPGPRYALRAYRAGWRTDDDVLYELDALTHLHAKGVPVSYPLRARDGTLVHVVHAPEGRRQVVLFTYAPGAPNGTPPNTDRSDYAHLYGRAVARIHVATDDFASAHARFAIDLRELLDRQMTAIQPLLEHRAEDWAYLVELVRLLHERAGQVPLEALDTGFCHGDFHGGNSHLDGDTLTFFDFDCCGPGWRAYDLSVFLWDNALGGKPRKAERRWRDFLRGYREVRPLAGVDLQAIPLFVAIRHIWLLGLHTANGRDWGHAWIHDRYFDRQLKFLREWEHRRLNRPLPRSWIA